MDTIRNEKRIALARVCGAGVAQRDEFLAELAENDFCPDTNNEDLELIFRVIEEQGLTKSYLTILHRNIEKTEKFMRYGNIWCAATANNAFHVDAAYELLCKESCPVCHRSYKPAEEKGGL